MDGLANVLVLIVAVALVTTIVGHQESANVIKAIGNSFSQAIGAAQGHGDSGKAL